MKPIWPPVAAERAAGIILYRRIGGATEFLLLRNALHGTWGFAKGRAESHEDPLETARREVKEETGIERFQLDPKFVKTIEYPVRTGSKRRSKVVMYFLAETAEEAIRSHEHDDMAWVDAAEAVVRIEHVNLRDVLDAAIATILPSG